MVLLAGIGFIPRFAGLASVGYSFTPGFMTELFMESGSYEFFGFQSTRMRTGVRGTYFPGNSFYLYGGLNHERFTGKDEEAFGSGGNTSTYEGVHSQIELEGGIGNRWTLDGGFTIGATWVGYSQGILPLEMASSGTNLSQARQNEKDDDLEEAARASSLHFCKFVLGFSF